MSNTSSFSKRDELIQYEQISLNIQYILLPDDNNWSIFWFILLIQLCSESAFILDTVCCIGEVFLSRAHPSVNILFLFLLCCHFFFLPKMLCCNSHNATPLCFSPSRFVTLILQILNPIISKTITSSWASASSWQHQQRIMLSLLGRAHSFKLVLDRHLYNLYSKVYKSFLPFQKWFSFCCSTECQWITICRPCYKFCVFCATFGFVLLSRREDKLSIKNFKW